MPFNNPFNEPFGVVNNPLTNSVFIVTFEEGGFPIPPESAYRVTDDDNNRVTDGPVDYRITD